MAYSNKPMRRSALIGPWGVGAIVPFPNDESLMIAGLDMWRYNDATPFIIEDERLQRRLGVQELRWPPDFRENGTTAHSAVQCKKQHCINNSLCVIAISGPMVVSAIHHSDIKER